MVFQPRTDPQALTKGKKEIGCNEKRRRKLNIWKNNLQWLKYSVYMLYGFLNEFSHF